MTYKVGDRVNFKFDCAGVVTNKTDNGVHIKFDNGSAWYLKERDFVYLSPAIEIFGPGDVVRDRFSKHIFFLGRDGYLSAQSGGFYDYNNVKVEFTSEHYERVEL